MVYWAQSCSRLADHSPVAVFLGDSVIEAFAATNDVLLLILDYAAIYFEWSLIEMQQQIVMVHHLSLPDRVRDIHQLQTSTHALYTLEHPEWMTSYAVQYEIRGTHSELIVCRAPNLQIRTVNNLHQSDCIASVRTITSRPLSVPIKSLGVQLAAHVAKRMQSLSSSTAKAAYNFALVKQFGKGWLDNVNRAWQAHDSLGRLIDEGLQNQRDDCARDLLTVCGT